MSPTLFEVMLFCSIVEVLQLHCCAPLFTGGRDKSLDNNPCWNISSH